MEVTHAQCFEVKVRADTAKFTNVIVARLRKCSDLIREDKMFVENKTNVGSTVGCSERAVLYFRELLLPPCDLHFLKALVVLMLSSNCHLH